MRIVGPLLFLLATNCEVGLAQSDQAEAIARLLDVDLAALSARQTLGAWQKAHGIETAFSVDDVRGATPVSDFRDLSLACASAVDEPLPDLRRVAQFLVPAVSPGKLPPFPDHADARLRDHCQLSGIWYETAAPVPAKVLNDHLQAR
jgi:hypothetical protein